MLVEYPKPRWSDKFLLLDLLEGRRVADELEARRAQRLGVVDDAIVEDRLFRGRDRHS